MRRKLTLETLREVVRRRRTKGAAFMLGDDEYHRLMNDVERELSGMTADQIMERWPEHTYDVRRTT